jgi:hypothetical protein
VAIKVCGVSGTVGVEIIVAENNDGIGSTERVFDDPTFSDKSKDGAASEIQYRTQHNHKEE